MSDVHWHGFIGKIDSKLPAMYWCLNAPADSDPHLLISEAVTKPGNTQVDDPKTMMECVRLRKMVNSV